MSLFSTLNVGASGLGVSSASLSVIGDNIANVNTTGFKQTRASFADFMPQTMFGLAGPSTLGTGAAVNRLTTLFGQGTLEATGNATDMAISGSGFFMVNNGFQNYYTRDGAFYVDPDGYLVNTQGMRVQGFNGDAAGLIGPVLDDLKLDTSAVPATATSTITLEAMMAESADAAGAYDNPLTTDAANFWGVGAGGITITQAANDADFSTSISIYDSRGTAHDITIVFEQTGTSDWNWYAITDAAEATNGAGLPFGPAGEAFQVASGTATFDTAGVLTASTQVNTAGWTFSGAAATNLTFDYTDLKMGGDTDSVTSLQQDGNGVGELLSVAVTSDGVISGTYTNGEQRVLGQVATATFQAEWALDRAGNNLFAATQEAGDPAIGVAGTGSRGAISGSALEKSNVNLEEQFVNMITAQRTYQANASVISTADESLQTLVNLV
jgi:flagellar hook protein FlgE